MMTINPHTVRFINLLLLFACLLAVLTAPFILPAKARVSCEYPMLASDPIKFSWASNISITVEIDDTWNASDREAFQSGISRWNDWKSFDCSNVTFATFNAHHFNDYSGLPPNNTVYWQQHEFGTNFLRNTTQHFGGSLYVS
jgi:hypothetical protein